MQKLDASQVRSPVKTGGQYCTCSEIFDRLDLQGLQGAKPRASTNIPGAIAREKAVKFDRDVVARRLGYA